MVPRTPCGIPLYLLGEYDGFTLQAPLSPPAAVAVAGAGSFGQFCMEAYRQSGDISVAAVADPNLAGSASPTHPELCITADWRNCSTIRQSR